MKSTIRVIQKKQAWLDLKRDRRSTWCRDTGERTTQFLEINVQRIDRPSIAHVETAPTTTNFRPAAKSTNPVDPLTLSRHFMIQAKPRRASTAAVPHRILLPPINGSRIITSKAERNTVPLRTGGTTLPKNSNARLSISSVMRENTVFRVLVARDGEDSQPFNKSNFVRGTRAVLNKGCVQDAETCSRLIKTTLVAEPAVASVPASLGPSITRQRNDTSKPSANDSGVMMADGIQPGASFCETKQQRDFSSDDSAIETESQCSEDKDSPKTGKASLCPDEDDEYYTDQRIAEWVLKVNSSLFSSSNDYDELNSSSTVEEQDTATIKIIYNGD